MKLKLALFLLALPLFQSCSWIEQFFLVNQTARPIKIELKLNKTVATFPIFHYGPLYSYPYKNKPDWDSEKDVSVDTLEDRSHFTFTLQPNTAVEVGRLENDKYEKHDQHFINDRVFNLEELSIKQDNRETKITPLNFDDHFKKTNGGVYYFVH